MPLSLFEIVELADGEVGLRKAGEEGEPLVTIKFSKEASDYVKEHKLDVVKAMIEAGMDVVGDLAESRSDEDQGSLELEPESRIIH